VTAATLPAPTEVPPDSGTGIVHTYCCDENRSLCGLDITTEPLVADPDPADECVVCAELDDVGGPCGVSGCWR
jgi:hypothetical protein